MKKYRIACIVILGSIISFCLSEGNYTEARENAYEVISSISAGSMENQSLLLRMIVSNNEKKSKEDILEEIEKRYKSNSLGGVLFNFEEQGMADKVKVYVYESGKSMEEGKLWFEENLY